MRLMGSLNMSVNQASASADIGTLYVVATPIGNLGDLSRRAENVLKSVQIVAAEDTRRTGVLLDHIGHRVPELISLHEHNEMVLAPKLINRMLAGDDVALVSDAGTPLINDPGFNLIRAASVAQIKAVPIPGACSITAALSVCPLACQPFRFVGFVPVKSGARRNFLADCIQQSDAVIFLEAPHRIKSTLEMLAELSDRNVMLARELTKKYETVLVGSAADLVEQLPNPKGEFVGIIEADKTPSASRDEREVMRILLKELPPAQAAKIGANICGVKKSVMYELAVAMEAK